MDAISKSEDDDFFEVFVLKELLSILNVLVITGDVLR
jgi:hypothetical protein